MLGGGGAHGAYQAGVLRGIARRRPDVHFEILTGISAGALNVIHLAAHEGPFASATEWMADLWAGLTPDQVFDVRGLPLIKNVFRWGARLASGGIGTGAEPMRGMVDTQPLRRFLTHSLVPDADGTIAGIARNIGRGTLGAVALTATSYGTHRSMTWVQGRDLQLWQRPSRRSSAVKLTVEHVMASSALPMLFPAIRIGDEWYGDGGIRLTSPLSPALHLGATHVLTVSTRYSRTTAEAASPQVVGYPPPAQVLGSLYNAVFLDMIDEDVTRMRMINRLLDAVPDGRWDGMRKVEIMVIRPSQDLGLLARDYEVRLPAFVKYLLRGLGTKDTTSPDLLSLVLFQRDYLERLIAIGEADGEAHAEQVAQFVHTVN